MKPHGQIAKASLKKDSSGSASPGNRPQPKVAQTFRDCMTGGYSVWKSRPLKPILPVTLKNDLDKTG
jgi:hypothetical protein